MATNSEGRKRWDDIRDAYDKNQGDVNDTEAAEAIEVLLDEADAKERALLSGVQPVDAIRYGFRECVQCGATWEEEQPPNEAIRRITEAYLRETTEITPQANADINLIYEWLDFLA